MVDSSKAELEDLVEGYHVALDFEVYVGSKIIQSGQLILILCFHYFYYFFVLIYFELFPLGHNYYTVAFFASFHEVVAAKIHKRIINFITLGLHLELKCLSSDLWVMYAHLEPMHVCQVVNNKSALAQSSVTSILLVAESKDAYLGFPKIYGSTNLLCKVFCNHFGKSLFLILVHVQDGLPILRRNVLTVGIENMYQREKVLFEAASSKAGTTT